MTMPVLKYPSHPGRLLKRALVLLVNLSSVVYSHGQSVSEIITDYNGFFKTGSAAINPVRPDNHHNLLAFSFNGTRYSTGVDDTLLASRGETFTAASFRALPMTNITGTPTSNTKIGLGAMADGVYNGAGAAPARNLGQYLNDGLNGLDMGTVIANLPSGTMFLSVSNLQASQIGDGIPDILVTQLADPSARYDRYAFTDVNGNMIGNFMDINLTNITPVGQWVADFYEATGSAVLQSGFTQTQRNMRLWAADFSAFGINASNIGNIAYFKIDLSGDSDIGFVAYNTTTVTVQQVLALPNDVERRDRNSRTSRDEVRSLKVFPNPATSEVNFVHPKSARNEMISIYNIGGVLVKQQPVPSNTSQSKLNVTSLRKGTYQAVYTNGTDKYSQKLLIQ